MVANPNQDPVIDAMRAALWQRVDELLATAAEDLPITKTVGGGPARKTQYALGDPHEIARQIAWLLDQMLDGHQFKSAQGIADQARAARRLNGIVPNSNPNFWEIAIGQMDGASASRELNLFSDLTMFCALGGVTEQWPNPLAAITRTRNLRAGGADDPQLHAPASPRFGLVAAQRQLNRKGQVALDGKGRAKAVAGGPHQRASAVLIAAAAAAEIAAAGAPEAPVRLFNPGSAALQPSPQDEQLNRDCERPLSVAAPADYLAGHVAQVMHRLDRFTDVATPVVFRSSIRKDLDLPQFRNMSEQINILTPSILQQEDWPAAIRRRFAERSDWVGAPHAPQVPPRLVIVQADEAIRGHPTGMRLHPSLAYRTSHDAVLIDQEAIVDLAGDPLLPAVRSEAPLFQPRNWRHPTLAARLLRGRFVRRQQSDERGLAGFIVQAPPAPRLVAVLDEPESWSWERMSTFLDALALAFADIDIEQQLPGCFVGTGPLNKGGSDPATRENRIRLNSAFSRVL